MMAAAQFPDCCGVIIISGFGGGHPNSNPSNCVTSTACNDFLEIQEKKHYNARAGLIVILSGPQNDQIGKVFVERKWKLVVDGINNARNDRKLFIYFRDLNHTPQRKKRIFGKEK